LDVTLVTRSEAPRDAHVKRVTFYRDNGQETRHTAKVS
jgi:hypothetical protein